MFEITPFRKSENALLASRPSYVSLVNGETIQVVIILQGHASFYFSNIDDVEALVELLMMLKLLLS